MNPGATTMPGIGDGPMRGRRLGAGREDPQPAVLHGHRAGDCPAHRCRRPRVPSVNRRSITPLPSTSRREPPDRPYRVATSSATMARPISAGSRPPRSSPMGAWRRAISASPRPAASRRARRSAWARRLPMAPTYATSARSAASSAGSSIFGSCDRTTTESSARRPCSAKARSGQSAMTSNPSSRGCSAKSRRGSTRNGANPARAANAATCSATWPAPMTHTRGAGRTRSNTVSASSTASTAALPSRTREVPSASAATPISRAAGRSAAISAVNSSRSDAVVPRAGSMRTSIVPPHMSPTSSPWSSVMP